MSTNGITLDQADDSGEAGFQAGRDGLCLEGTIRKTVIPYMNAKMECQKGSHKCQMLQNHLCCDSRVPVVQQKNK